MMKGSWALRSGAPGGRKRRGACASAFTLVELLVVIVVIGLLIAMVVVVGSKVIKHQKTKYTETIMRTVVMAIEQSSAQDPLGGAYDRTGGPGPDHVPGTLDDVRPTFGSYPPYQLYRGAADVEPSDTVWEAVEPYAAYAAGFEGSGSPPYNLSNRLFRDLAQGHGSIRDWVRLNENDLLNDDIRALHAYLEAFSPGILASVPADRLQPLSSDPEYVNRGPTQSSGIPQPGDADSTWFDVLGIHDAWDVPLDYFLYVKLEYVATGNPTRPGEWRVTDRRPVLRSRGIKREVYDVWIEARLNEPVTPPPDTAATWIFSAPFPAPLANRDNINFWQSGVFNESRTTQNGWARALSEGDVYIPQDGVRGDTAFGYVP